MGKPKADYQRHRAALDDKHKEGIIQSDDYELITSYLDAHDPDNLLQSPRQGKKTHSYRTLDVYTRKLDFLARQMELSTADTLRVNQHLQQMKEADKSANTINSYGTCFRSFYRHHEHLDVDPDGIAKVECDTGNGLSPEDMLTQDEVHAMIRAPDSSRDRAVVGILLYTGMRNQGLTSLLVGNANLRTNRWEFNSNADGLKRADKHGKSRPLLGASGLIKQWLKDHPDPDNPEAHLITGKPGHYMTDASEPVDESTIRRIVHNAAEKAGITKPTHPHALRHNFVTICRRDYGLNDGDIKHLIGHSDASNVMQSTYSHLSDEHHNRNAERGFGLLDDDDEPESSLTPPACYTCDELLKPTDKACSNCGRAYTPDAHGALEHAQESVTDSALEVEPGSEQADALSVLKDLLKNNPDVVTALLDDDDEPPSAPSAPSAPADDD